MSIILFDDLLHLYTGISIFGKISAIFLSIIVSIYYIVRNKFSKIIFNNIILFLFIILLNFIINYLYFKNTFYITSFIFEVYKLGIFFSLFILILLNKKDSLTVVHYSINLFAIFIIINLLVLILQHLFGANITKYIGISSSAMDFQIERNRPSGITTGANIIGVSSLFIMIFFYYIKTNYIAFILSQKQRIICNWIFIASALNVILSTSKNALLLLIIFPFFIKKINLRLILILITIPLFIFIFLLEYNIYGLKDKLLMYQYVVNNYDSFNSSLVEHRALSILNGFHIFSQNFPFGTGLGSWGDYSSSFNPYIIDKNIMSDSYFIHLLVEQGFLIFLYFALLFKTLNFDKIGYFTFLSLIIIFLPTMGFGASTFPYIFSYLLFIFNLKNLLQTKGLS